MPARLLLALVSGLSLALAFEPVRLWPFLVLSVTGWAISVHGLTPRRALLPGLVFGVAFYFLHIEWMRVVGVDAWIGLASVEAAFYVLVSVLAATFSRHRWWPLWAASAWSVAEVVRSSWPFSGMPWGRLSFGVVDTPAAPALAWLGTTGVSFVLALLGCLLADLVLRLLGRRGAGVPRRAWRRPAYGVGAVLVLVALTDLLPVRMPVDGTTTVAVVQGDVPGAGDDLLAVYREVTANQVAATERLGADVEAGRVPPPDFVLWPENSTAVDPFADLPTNAQITAAVEAVGVPVLAGVIVDDGPDHVLNQGIVWDPDTGAGERYTKRHPVAFGEYIPFRRYLGGLADALKEVARDMDTGTRRTPLEVAGVPVADAICFDVGYDDVFSDQVRRGARLLAVQTSNATFVKTHQLEQQFAITRVRAIEAGRDLVVASTNGISGVVAADGSVVARAPVRSTTTLVQQVSLHGGVTPGVRLGRWTPWLFTALSLLGLALSVLRRRAGGTMGETPASAGPASTPVHEETSR